MRCDDVLVNLPDYILKRTEPNLSRDIESHLANCPTCREEKEKLSEVISVLSTSEPEEYPVSFWNELHASIMSRLPRRRRRYFGMNVPQLATVMTLLVIGIGIGIYELTVRSGTSETRSISTLAASLPPEEVIALPAVNTDYVQTAAPVYVVDEEVNSVDDTLQQALVKSMWATVADTVSTSDYPDLVDIDLLN
ncbi:MAG: anti-sigma factor family protein [Candidatus Kryptoniota bacterium]